MNVSDDLALHYRKLFLRNHEVVARIGVHDFEKVAPQRVLFNVDVYVALQQTSAHTDDLRDVVDYDFIRQVIAQRVAQGHIQLQETLCDDVTTTLLAHPRVHAVRLSTEKPDVYPDAQAVGVEVFRIKA